MLYAVDATCAGADDAELLLCSFYKIPIQRKSKEKYTSTLKKRYYQIGAFHHIYKMVEY